MYTANFQIEPFEFEAELEGEVNRSSRDYIKWVQRSLNKIMGLNLAVDGISGTHTRSAIRSFQQQRRLTVDGIVGSQTERALIAAGAGNPPGIVSPPSGPSQPSPGTTPSVSWVLPPDVRAAGERQLVRYDRPPSWDNGRNCTGSLTAGAAELRNYVRTTFPGISAIGGYNCRQNTANLAETSVHGTGRALDIMIPQVGSRANSSVGDPIANWLVQNAEALGVQYIIWNHIRWSGSRSGRKDGAYGGPSPHIDHIHVELNRDGAARSTPWFLSRTQRTGSSETWAGEVNDESFYAPDKWRNWERGGSRSELMVEPPVAETAMELESELELRPEFREFETGLASPSTNAVSAGERYLDTSRLPHNPLRGHGGTGDNLALRWNAVPRDAQEIDVVIHLHGYIDIPPDSRVSIAQPPTSNTLHALVAKSGLELSGRARPTLALVPRGRRITAGEVRREQERLNELARKLGKKPGAARSDRFAFPALWSGNGAGIESLIEYAVDWFARNVLGRSDGRSLRVGRLIFTAHSGGGAALNELLKQHARRRACNPEEVQSFDALYGKVDGVKSWVAARLAKDRAIGATSPGGGLRVIYRAGTQPGSCEVEAMLPHPGDPLRAWYRAERTQVGHNDIPTKFGGPLLRNRAADFGLQSECAARSNHSSAPRTTRSSTSNAPSTTPPLANNSLFQQIQNALASGQWYLGLGLAGLAGMHDENKLTNMIFFARHPERGGRKLEKSEPNFKQLSQEWLDIRDRIIRPFLTKAAPAKPSGAKPAGPVMDGKPYPEVNTPLPPGGQGFVRRNRRDQEMRSYGLPETIQALQDIALEWHKADPQRPRIQIMDISPPGGSLGRFEPHSSHRVGLDVDLNLEDGKSIWYYKKGQGQWQENPKYSKALTAELARLILTHPKGGLKVQFILFDDPKIRSLFNKVRQDKTSPHRDHFHVRFCAPAYFAPKVDNKYKSCT